MGKFRSKLKGQSKGKRWPKGQSSVSNPETRKYRDLAKSRFFQENLGPSNLTFDALKQHDAVQTFKIPSSTINTMETEDNLETTTLGSASTYQTMQSFASEWSECSNMSFSRFLKVFRSDSALHKEMLAVLAAIAEVIKDNGGTESPTEYYCALLTTLEQVYNAENRNEEQLTAVLSLIKMGVKTVPDAVLRTNFNDVASKMIHILKEYCSQENNTVIRSIFGILSVLITKQELACWSHDFTLQIFQSILNPFSIHNKPKWRKAAQQCVAQIVRAEYFTESPNIAARYVAKFCEETLETCMGGNTQAVLVSSVQAGQTTILHTLGLMKDNITHFSEQHVKKCCEIILRLMTLNYPVVTSCGLQVLHSLFSAQKAVLSSTLNLQLISALYDYQPASGDVQPTLAWLAVMQQAHVHLADVDLVAASNSLPKIFATVAELWLSDKPQIMTAVTHTLEILLKDALGPICNQADQSKIEWHLAKLSKCFATIQQGLHYQFHSVWDQVLHTIEVLFEVAGTNCGALLESLLKELAELRDSYKFSYNNELEHAIGSAIRSMGPETVLSVISLKRNGEMNLDRSWMLPVLKENIKGSTLDYFVREVLPLALSCQKRARQLANSNDGIGAHSAELFYMQLWNLLPCFCNHPVDIRENFKSLAKVLGTAISDRKELRLSVMAALRKLILSAKASENEEDIRELARFDKNYLPILFNVYSTKPIGSDEEGQRLAALDTIKIYLSIAKTELAHELLKNAIERLNSQSEDPEDSFIKESILDLIRALVPYQNVENIKMLYDQCIKSLATEMKNNKKEQKKAYRLLEEICASQSEQCKQFLKEHRKGIQSLLWKALESSAVSSKGARLRCLNYLIKSQPELDHEAKLIRRVIPEAVLSCKDINERTRNIAYQVLNTIGEILQGHNQLEQFLKMIVGGMAGNIQLISCSILALSSILYNFSMCLGQENIEWLLEKITELATAPSREIAGPCLSFVKVYCKIMPSAMVCASLGKVMKVLTNMTDDCKRHFRIKVRDLLNKLVRKYGCDYLMPHVPSDDTIMHKRLKNIRKMNARKKKQKEREDDDNISEEDEFMVKGKQKSIDEILADSDSESDLDNLMETDQRQRQTQKRTKSKQSETWIEEDAENIVDFADANVVKKITATKPGAKLQQQQQQQKKSMEKDRGFKTAIDGRLIIKDDSESDSDNDDKRNNSDDSDLSDRDESIAETLALSDRKRKRSSSGQSVKSLSTAPPQAKYKTGGVGIHRATTSSAASVAGSVKSVGSEYRSKKARGDVKKKGRPDPYAYVPLSRSAINKRKKNKKGGQFNNLIKAAKHGALKGAKAKKFNKKK